MYVIVKRVFRFNNYKPRSIDQQKDIRVYNRERNSRKRNYTRCYRWHTLYPEHYSREPCGITTDIIYIEDYKTRRPIGVGGPRYDGRDLARDQNRVYLASFNYYSATLISRPRSLAEYEIVPFVASPAISWIVYKCAVGMHADVSHYVVFDE